MGFFKNIFKKKKSKDSKPFFRETKDIIVKTDAAFSTPTRDIIKELESKILVSHDDYKNMEFEDHDSHIVDLSNMSEKSKNAIMKIVRQEYLDRHQRAEKITQDIINRDL